jgi:hypothetical protein
MNAAGSRLSCGWRMSGKDENWEGSTWMLEALVALCVGGLVTLAVRGYLRVHGRRVAAQRFYRDRFYDIAERLYTDEALSDDMLERIRTMVNDLDDPRMFGELWSAVFDIEHENGVPRDHPIFRSPTNDALGREWATLLHSYLMTISYYRGFRGVLVRATLATVLDPETIERRAETINWRIHKWPPRPPLRVLVRPAR